MSKELFGQLYYTHTTITLGIIIYYLFETVWCIIMKLNMTIKVKTYCREL